MDDFSKLGRWLSKPFPKKMSFFNLTKYWIAFFIVAIAIRSLALFFFPQTGLLEEQFIADFCTFETLLIVVLAPLTENIIFMILPYKFFKGKGLAVGLALWALLHYLDRDLPSFSQNVIIAMFYYKLVSAKKYKESIFFHGIINWIAGLSCI
ncbi:MAG: hypothetical protein V1678_01495 [Candidatus Aenigmatarchaeota archaeon]